MGGKTALITGGSRGIGKAIAECFARHHIQMGIVYRTHKKLAECCAGELEKLGGNARAYQCDLRNLDAIDTLVENVIKDFTTIDILVNNAGVTKFTPFLEISSEEWKELLMVNLESAFYLSQQCAKQMLKKKWGRIINIGSLGGERLISGVAAHYAASKAGLSGLTRVMAKELGRYNILVNCVAPGLIETDLTDALPIQRYKAFQKNHPLKRMGTPEEVAALVGFLASEQASYITGETFLVSGGLM